MQDYDTFFDAKEDNLVYSFLGLPPPPGSKVGTIFCFSTADKIIKFLLPLNQAVHVVYWTASTVLFVLAQELMSRPSGYSDIIFLRIAVCGEYHVTL